VICSGVTALQCGLAPFGVEGVATELCVGERLLGCAEVIFHGELGWLGISDALVLRE